MLVQIDDKLHKVSEAIIERITDILKEKEHILVAIDGSCAAGKTTLAGLLKKQLDCQIIHMDDFFLRPEQRTKERMEEPGANVDYERFFIEVLTPLRERHEFFYRPYNCQTQSLDEPISVKMGNVTIIEGAYSCHPALWEDYDLHIFLDVDEIEQKKRIMVRNGQLAWKRFEELWIPLEEKYFTECKIKEKCELCFEI